MLTLNHSTVAIVGLGLMGGSLALALKEKTAVAKIIGVTRTRSTLDRALVVGAIDQASLDLHAVADSNIIVLAAPVRTILKQIPRLADIAADGALILDLGSTKVQVVGAMNQLPERLFAVGCHPMCGKETSGFEVAEPTLYQNKTWVVTPTARAGDDAIRTAVALAEAVGARALFLDAERHDRIVAGVSHLPFVVAANLVSTVDEFSGGDERFWQVASSGFQDTSRLAASEVEMMLDILMTNSENIADLMRRYSRHFGRLADLIYDEEEPALRVWLAAAAARRRELQREKTNRAP